MRHFGFIAIVSVLLTACGGDAAPNFAGEWSGSFTRSTNACPFSVNEDVNPLFPMSVSVDVNDVFTVRAVTGETATGGQGQGESISFLASSPKFGNYGSTGQYTCQKILSEIGFLSVGEDKAKVDLVIKFTDCATADAPTKITSCGVTYFGDGVRVGK